MANRVIASQKEQFDREIAAYRGDDPLKLRYDFLLWLDSNFGKDKVIDIFTSTLEEALNTHWNDARYKEDNRLIELQMIYATLQPNPLTIYQSYYDRGVAQQSSVLYVNWANHLAAAGDFAGADKIFKMGSEKTSSALKPDLNTAFEKFLARVGRKFLDGEIPVEKEVLCAKCNIQQSAAPTPAAEQIIALEMNPGKPDNWDDFQTAVAYFDPPDSKGIPMYPKDKVYKDPGKEYSLEEVKAAQYFEKLKKKEQQIEALKQKEKANKKSVMSFEPSFEADHIRKEGVFPTPLLPSSGKEDSIAAQSFTTRTKLAMHLVQNMWSSPTPEVQPSILTKNEEKPKTTFPIYVDENPETPKAAEKKPVAPFQVFTDSPDDVPKINNNQASLSKKTSTTKKNGLQTKCNVLSERKLKNEDIAEEPKTAVKQQLHFENDSTNDVLARKLSETSVSDPRTPFQPFGGIKPLFPVEPGKDDFSDVTCNTKAFNFALPSSTPVQQRKSLAPYHSAHQNGGSNIPQDERSSYHTQQNLSVILEASKERCSSSGSSTGSSQPRTPAFPTKTPLKVVPNFCNDRSAPSSGPGAVHSGSAQSNRSFTWICNRSHLNLSLKTPNCSQRGEDPDPPSAYTCSSLKFRLSSEKLTALKSIKQNYFLDQSKTRSFKTSPDFDECGNHSPLLPIPSDERRCSGAMLMKISRLCKSKNECNVSNRTNGLSLFNQSLGTASSLYGNTVGAKEPIDSDGLVDNCDVIHNIAPCESCNTRAPPNFSNDGRSWDASEPMDSKSFSCEPKSRNKAKRSSLLRNQNSPCGGSLPKMSGRPKGIRCDPKLGSKAKRSNFLRERHPPCDGSLVSKAGGLKSNSCDPKVRRTDKQRSNLCKKSRHSFNANKSSKINALENHQNCCSPAVSSDASKGPSSVMKPVLPTNILRDPRMRNSNNHKNYLSVENRPSVALSNASTFEIDRIRRCSIKLSRISTINGSPVSLVHNFPKKNKVPSRKSIENSDVEDSPFALCNIRKDSVPSKIKLKRNLNADVPKQLIMEDCNDIDPFCPMITDKLLSLLNFPQQHHVNGYQLVASNLPTVSKNVRLGNDMFTSFGDLGKGAYARVVKASIENANVALKIEKPACKWEFYIAKEIQKRVDPKMRSAFMDIKTAYIFTNGSVLMTEWAKHGSLLNIINQYKQHTGKVLEPVLSLHFAIEVTRAVEYLHKCKIIHGDIKPDNYVVRSLPTLNETEPCLMLIDFGRSIDMTLFPEGTKFSRVVTTEGFQCNEMKEQRPWNYQTDLYGLAGCIYCLLIGEYMKVVKKNDEWKLHKTLPRNMKRDLWDPIFHQLLNVPSCEQLPNVTEIRKTLEAAFADFNHYVKLQYFNHLSNIVMGK